MEDTFEGRGDVMILTTFVSKLDLSGTLESQRQQHAGGLTASNASHANSSPATPREARYLPESHSITNRKRKAQDQLAGIDHKRRAGHIVAPEDLKYRPSTSPHASLLGLPVELRLRIYDLVLTPTVVHNIDPSKHCCSMILKPICNCFGRHSTSILRVGRKIFEEAMPVLYNTTEFRVSTPVCFPRQAYSKDPDVLVQLMRLPRYGREHIRRLFVACYVTNICELAPIMVRRFCEKVKTYLPATRYLRLRVEVGARMRRNDPRDPAFSKLAELAALPNLKTVRIEARGCKVKDNYLIDHFEGPYEFRTRRQPLVAAVESKIEGKKVEVVDTVRDFEAYTIEYLKPIESILNELRDATEWNIPATIQRHGVQGQCLSKIGQWLKGFVKGSRTPATEATEQGMWDYIAELYWPHGTGIGYISGARLKACFEWNWNR